MAGAAAGTPARGVRIVGDAPIFVAHHSADSGRASPVSLTTGSRGGRRRAAGLFSATGQRWGNPLYRWPAHAAEGYAWWTARIRRIFELVDIVRIDHFRGFARYWEIPASAPTAVDGRWCDGPGAELFDAIAAGVGPLPSSPRIWG